MDKQQLRSYQIDCMDILRNEVQTQALSGQFLNGIERMKGRVVIPTGGGKTHIEATFLNDRINDGGFGIHLVTAPTIVLTNQLSKEYRRIIGQDYLGIAFHSSHAEPDYTQIKWDEKATTSPEVIREEIERAKRMGKDLVIFSTYHSSWKLTRFELDTMICDESQHCTASHWYTDISNVRAKHKLFFTATERWTNNGRGLNNEGVYGPVLYQITPKELIKDKYIVPPKLHVLYGDTDMKKTLIDEVIRVARFQDARVRKMMPFSKTLFAMKGTEQVALITENIDKLKAALPEHTIFTIISNPKYGSMIDGVRVSRDQFMKVLRDCENALIFHYRILAEGIDVDGITGVYIMRAMGLAMLLQTIGRSVRTYKPDPELKTEALISCSVIDNDESNKLWLKYVLTSLRLGGFEMMREEIIVDETSKGAEDETEIDDAYDSTKNVKMINGILIDVYHEIEDDDAQLVISEEEREFDRGYDEMIVRMKREVSEKYDVEPQPNEELTTNV